MRILFFHQIYKTPEEGGGIRSWYVANALAQRGHEVTVITAAKTIDRSPKSEDRRPKSEDRSPKSESLITNHTSHSVIHLPVAYSNNLSFPQRILSFLNFLWLARKEAKKREYDLVYAISVPLTTGLLALWTRKPYVFEVGDLWPDVPIQMGILKNPILKWYTRRLERKIYKNAGLIISLSPDIQRHIYTKVNSVPNIVVPNFTDSQLLKAERPKSANLLASPYLSGRQSPIICTYIGTAGIANNLMQMVALAGIAEKTYPEILFCMMIEGMEEEKIKKAAPGNMVFEPYGGKDKVAGLLSITDFNFVCYAQYPLLGTGSPNKFFDGLATGCIAVMNVKGWISDLLVQRDCGLFWNIADHEGLLRRIREIKNSGKDRQMMKRSSELAREFDKDRMCEKIAGQIEWRFG